VKETFLRGPERFGPLFYTHFQLRLKSKWCIMGKLFWLDEEEKIFYRLT